MSTPGCDHASPPSIRLRGVRKRFGDFTAVDGFDLEVLPGRIHGFLGPNGAGKTTTIRMIMDIIAPDEGTVEIFGAPRDQGTNRRIGYLPEERGLYKKMTVFDTLEYFARLHGLVKGAALKTRIDEWLLRFQLQEWAAKKIEALSKGMAQKVQFIATILHEPELVILDEPFSGLDPVNTDLLTDIIRGLKAAQKTVVFSTHVMEQAEKLCDEVVLINRGRKVLDGPLAEIKRTHGRGGFRVQIAGELALLGEIPVVESFQPLARLQNGAEVALKPGAGGADLLRALLERTEVRRFEEAEPSLHDIFIAVVGLDVFAEAAREAADQTPRAASDGARA